MLDLIITYAGILIFMGLIVFDTKYIKQMTYSAATQENTDAIVGRLSIIGALKLYLDFINMFLFHQRQHRKQTPDALGKEETSPDHDREWLQHRDEGSVCDARELRRREEQANAQALREQLVQACRLRFLRADVPVGAYLSGGIDSSVTSALVTQYTEAPLRTFSLRFADSEFDEGQHRTAGFARRTNRRSG